MQKSHAIYFLLRQAVVILLLGFVTVGCDNQPMVQQWSQATSWDIYPSTARPRPDDPFILKLEGSFPVSATIKEAPYPNLITQMIVRDYDRTIFTENGRKKIRVLLTVEAAVEGVYAIPPIPIGIQEPGHDQVVLETLPLYLDISLKAAEDATDIRGPKPIRARDRTMWIVAGVAGVLIAIMVVALVLWLRRRVIVVPPYEELDATLVAVSNQLLDKNSAFAISGSVRGYIGRSMQIRALEKTVTELHQVVKSSNWSSAERTYVLQLLDICGQLDDIKYRPKGQQSDPVEPYVADIRSIAARLRDELAETKESTQGGTV